MGLVGVFRLPRCRAVRKDGKQCTQKVYDDDIYCGIHKRLIYGNV